MVPKIKLVIISYDSALNLQRERVIICEKWPKRIAAGSETYFWPSAKGEFHQTESGEICVFNIAKTLTWNCGKSNRMTDTLYIA